eukprot:15444969-Alexandrium_andersonii.AAC.1
MPGSSRALQRLALSSRGRGGIAVRCGELQGVARNTTLLHVIVRALQRATVHNYALSRNTRRYSVNASP